MSDNLPLATDEQMDAMLTIDNQFNELMEDVSPVVRQKILKIMDANDELIASMIRM